LRKGIHGRGEITGRKDREDGRAICEAKVLANRNRERQGNTFIQVSMAALPINSRGEIINGIDPDDREPDPDRLLQYNPLTSYLIPEHTSTLQQP
jgi:hypothetical protein